MNSGAKQPRGGRREREPWQTARAREGPNFASHVTLAALPAGGGGGGGSSSQIGRLEVADPPPSPPCRSERGGRGRGGEKNGAPPCACRGHWWAPRLISTRPPPPAPPAPPAPSAVCPSSYAAPPPVRDPEVFWVSSLHTRAQPSSPRPLRNFPGQAASRLASPLHACFTFSAFLFFLLLFLRRPGPPPPLLWPPCLRYIQVSRLAPAGSAEGTRRWPGLELAASLPVPTSGA